MSFAVLLAVNDFLAYTSLYVLVHIGVGETQQQAVRPFLVYDPQLADNCFVVVGIVEAFHPFLFASVDASGLEVFHRSVHVVVIVRIVLESIDFVGESVFERLPEIHIRFVCIERTVRIGCVQKPSVSFLFSDDIDHASDCIRTEAYRDHSLIDFDTFGKVYRDVVQPERTSHTFLRHTVDKYFHMFAAETVQRKLHVRTDTSGFTHFHSRSFCQCLAQASVGILQFFRVECYGIECRTFQTAYSV